MSTPPAADSSSGPQADTPPLPPPSVWRWFFRRLLGGVFFVLPVLLTLFVVYQIYLLLNAWLIEPVALLIIPRGIENEYWTPIEKYVTPPLTLLAVVLFLYVMGYLFQTRINRWTNWLFGRVPGVSTLYRGISEVIAALQGPRGLKKIDTVVVVPFPHERARMVGFLMGETTDTGTGRELLCVYVPLGVFPPSGYTLVFPREDVIVTDWDAAAPWKVLLSGGLTLPESVPFTRGGASPTEPSAEA